MENRRTKLTKRLLKESLIEILYKKDISHITIKEVCENADLNRSTFYSYYQSIYQLLEEITNDMISHVPFSDGKSQYTHLELEEYIQYIHNHKNIYSVLLNQGAFHQLLTKKCHDQFLKSSLSYDNSKSNNIEYYDALSAYCISGTENFLSYCLESSISIKEQAQILYLLISQAKSILSNYFQ